ncbi:MAG: RNA polymerase sigma factor [Myxococcota bacterium]
MAEAKRLAPTEKELAQRCAAGDRAAQLELFEAQRRQVQHTLYRIMGSNREMEDLAQETFIQVFRSIASFRAESSLATWVDSIAARVAFQYLSRRRAPHLSVVPEAASAGDEPERTVRARRAVRRLYLLLDRIPAKYRIAYALHVIDGRPLHEVARIMGIRSVAAKSRVWRARRMVHQRAARDPLLSEFLNETGDA